MNLDSYLMTLAEEAAKHSGDKDRKVGCVITDKDGRLLVSGYNELPTGCAPLEERRCRPHKYLWTEHAERRALNAAARFGVAVDGGKGASSENCWLWKACTDSRGYGMLHIGRRDGRSSTMMRAHRVSLELHIGRELRAGEYACHKCNNPRCVNPSHLYVGSHSDNMADLSRSRAVAGERHSKSKLTDAQRVEAQELRMVGWMVKDIAKKYGMSESHMSRIIREPVPAR